MKMSWQVSQPTKNMKHLLVCCNCVCSKDCMIIETFLWSWTFLHQLRHLWHQAELKGLVWKLPQYCLNSNRAGKSHCFTGSFCSLIGLKHIIEISKVFTQGVQHASNPMGTLTGSWLRWWRRQRSHIRRSRASTTPRFSDFEILLRWVTWTFRQGSCDRGLAHA